MKNLGLKICAYAALPIALTFTETSLATKNLGTLNVESTHTPNYEPEFELELDQPKTVLIHNPGGQVSLVAIEGNRLEVQVGVVHGLKGKTARVRFLETARGQIAVIVDYPDPLPPRPPAPETTIEFGANVSVAGLVIDRLWNATPPSMPDHAMVALEVGVPSKYLVHANVIAGTKAFVAGFKARPGKISRTIHARSLYLGGVETADCEGVELLLPASGFFVQRCQGNLLTIGYETALKDLFDSVL